MVYRRKTFKKKRSFKRKRMIYKKKGVLKRSPYRETGKAVECNIYMNIIKDSTLESYDTRWRVHWGSLHGAAANIISHANSPEYRFWS